MSRGITVLVSVKWVKLKAKVHSMMPPATASPKDSPKEPAPEFTPAERGFTDAFLSDGCEGEVVELGH